MNIQNSIGLLLNRFGLCSTSQIGNVVLKYDHGFVRGIIVGEAEDGVVYTIYYHPNNRYFILTALDNFITHPTNYDIIQPKSDKEELVVDAFQLLYKYNQYNNNKVTCIEPPVQKTVHKVPIQEDLGFWNGITSAALGIFGVKQPSLGLN